MLAGKVSRGQYYEQQHSSNVKLLTTAAMVDNLAKKCDECPLNVRLAYNWNRENCPLYGVAGCPLFRSGEWKDSRDFQNCPLYRGCPLFRGVRAGFHCTVRSPTCRLPEFYLH